MLKAATDNLKGSANKNNSGDGLGKQQPKKRGPYGPRNPKDPHAPPPAPAGHPRRPPPPAAGGRLYGSRGSPGSAAFAQGRGVCRRCARPATDAPVLRAAADCETVGRSAGGERLPHPLLGPPETIRRRRHSCRHRPQVVHITPWLDTRQVTRPTSGPRANTRGARRARPTPRAAAVSTSAPRAGRGPGRRAAPRRFDL